MILLLEIIFDFLSLLSSLIPKDPNRVLFLSIPDFSDNPRYLYEFLKEHYPNLKMIWVAYSDEKVFETHGIPYVKFLSFSYFKELFRSKYFVVSHAVPLFKPRNQVGVVLWHGLPLKNIGYYFKGESRYFLGRMSKNTTFFIATSPIMRAAFSSAFKIDPKKVKILGQPRCDVLLSLSYNQGRNNIAKVLKTDVDKFEKIIIYMPTYRDGRVEVTREIIEQLITNKDLKRFLEQNHILLVYKPHTFEEKYFLKKYGQISDNIKLLLSQNLLEVGLTIYDLLPGTDLLITDYSSVYFDYLLLDRPIVYYVPDIGEYKKTRGFLLEPFEFWAPGEKVKTVEELVNVLHNILIKNEDVCRYERKLIRDLSFVYPDSASSKRIAKFLFGKN
nr:CDP-glycerol glycerophosphotransferase family protein [Thermococcus sp. 9N3]